MSEVIGNALKSILGRIINDDYLKRKFQAAKDNNDRFIGLVIKMDGFEKDEVIINERENFDAKLNYYLNTYDECLVHKFSKGIRIMNIASGNSFDDIQADLID